MRDLEFIKEPRENDYRVAAEYALSQGDSEQAASMIAAALAMDPQNESCLRLLDRVVASAPDPLSLFDPTKDSFFGKVAVRSRLLAAQGRVLEALELLTQVVAFRPEVPYLTWVPEWLKCAQLPVHESPSRIRWQPLLAALAAPNPDRERCRQNSEAMADVLALLVERYPEDHALLVLHVRWLRQLEQHERVLTDLRRFDASKPSHLTRLLLGQSLRRVGLLQECLRYFEDATAMQPTEPSVWLDLADVQLETGAVELALKAYGRAMALDPRNSWARASQCYVHALRTGDPVEIAELHAQSQHEPRARDLLLDAEFLERRFEFPESAGARVLFDFCRRIRSSHPSGPPKLRLRVTSPEPPSFHHAFRLTTRALGLPDAELEITADGRPDSALDPEAARLWDYTQDCPHPLLPRPNDSTLDALRAISNDSAQGLAACLEGGAALSVPVEQLASAAFYVPAPPSCAISPPEWLFKFQVVCLLAIAHSEQGWFGSARRRWLYDLATGHVDWISAAAMIALGVVLRDNDQAAPEIQRWFGNWLAASPVGSPHCYERYLIASWMRAPSLSAETERQLWQRRIALRPRSNAAS